MRPVAGAARVPSSASREKTAPPIPMTARLPDIAQTAASASSQSAGVARASRVTAPARARSSAVSAAQGSAWSSVSTKGAVSGIGHSTEGGEGGTVYHRPGTVGAGCTRGGRGGEPGEQGEGRAEGA